MADFQEMEPELSEQAIYSEFEDTLQIVDAESSKPVVSLGDIYRQDVDRFLPEADLWPVLIREDSATR